MLKKFNLMSNKNLPSIELLIDSGNLLKGNTFLKNQKLNEFDLKGNNDEDEDEEDEEGIFSNIGGVTGLLLNVANKKLTSNTKISSTPSTPLQNKNMFTSDIKSTDNEIVQQLLSIDLELEEELEEELMKEELQSLEETFKNDELRNSFKIFMKKYFHLETFN